jgi:hypothetical protein
MLYSSETERQPLFGIIMQTLFRSMLFDEACVLCNKGAFNGIKERMGALLLPPFILPLEFSAGHRPPKIRTIPQSSLQLYEACRNSSDQWT